MRIQDVNLKIIKDSRGTDTIECTLIAEGHSVRASVPRGVSTGSKEIAYLNPAEALLNFETIKSNLLSLNFATLYEFDSHLKSLDGTPNKCNLGGNVILALSIAFTKLLAKASGMELFLYLSVVTNTSIKTFPYLFFNLVEGGKHADNSSPFQEYLVVPDTKSPKKSLESILSFWEVLKKTIQKKYNCENYGYEGGLVTPSHDWSTNLDLLTEVSQDLAGGDISYLLALDVAASTFYSSGSYNIDSLVLSTVELAEFYGQLLAKYHVFSIEDPFSEFDTEGFRELLSKVKEQVLVVGDDLTVTNEKRIKEMAEEKAISGVIIKPNQIGSVSETLDAIKEAKKNGVKTIISHRAEETDEDFIADLAVGTQSEGLKSGAPTQRQRLVKYRRLVQIEEILAKN